MLKCSDLNGKKAIITGAASGLSLGMAEALNEQGVEITILDISDKGEDVAAELSAKGAPAHFIKANLSDRGQLKEKFAEALASLGGELDILINGAGVQRVRSALDFTLEDWDFVINIDLNATFFLCQLAGREMLKKKKGKIINIASMNSFSGGTTIVAYTAAKGGVNQLTKSLCDEWAKDGICINAIAPGYMTTPLNAKHTPGEKIYEFFKSLTPADRWGLPEDMKGLTVFLCSEESDFVNGATISCDGGCMAR